MRKMKPFTAKEASFSLGRFVYRNTLTGKLRKRWWTKARVPGTVRKSRLPGGSGFRNNWEGVLPALLLAVFLSSCLWAVPGIARGVPTDGLRSVGVSSDPCGGTAFATRFYGDSVRCLTAMGPLEIPRPAYSLAQQRPIPFLVDSDWYFNKAPIAKSPERFHHEYKLFVSPEQSMTSMWAVPIALVVAAMLLTYVSLNDWEKPFKFDDPGLTSDKEKRV